MLLSVLLLYIIAVYRRSDPPLPITNFKFEDQSGLDQLRIVETLRKKLARVSGSASWSELFLNKCHTTSVIRVLGVIRVLVQNRSEP